jgi:RHS repeat-associated protein
LFRFSLSVLSACLENGFTGIRQRQATGCQTDPVTRGTCYRLASQITGLFVFVWVATLPCIAQLVNTDQVGIVPYGTYSGGTVDQVNMANGSLTVKIPLYSLPQRGKLALSLSVTLNSSSIGVSKNCNIIGIGTIDQSGSKECEVQYTTNLQYPNIGIDQELHLFAGTENNIFAYIACEPDFGDNSDPWDGPWPGSPVQCQTYSDFIQEIEHSVTDATGAQHYLAYDKSTSYATLRTVDGSEIQENTNDPNAYQDGATGPLYDAQGIKYQRSQDGSYSITDPNGNSINIDSKGNVTDSLGRQFTDYPVLTSDLSKCPSLGYPNQPLVSATQWLLPGPADAPNKQIPIIFCFATVNIHTGVLYNNGNDALGVSSVQTSNNITYDITTDYHEQVLSTSLLQSIILPDNTYWAFSYDSAATGQSPTIGYGSLLSIREPHGGSITYEAPIPAMPCIRQPDPNFYSIDDAGGYPYYPFVLPYYKRTVSDGQGTSGVWNYDFAQTGSSAPVSTATDPNGNQTIYQFTALDSCQFQESGSMTYDGAASTGKMPRRTVQKDYTTIQNPSYNNTGITVIGPRYIPTLQSESVTLDSGVTTTTTYSRNATFVAAQPNCSVSDVNDPCVYGIGGLSTMNVGLLTGTSTTGDDGHGGNLTITTATDYVALDDQSYYIASLFDLPSSVTISGTGGNSSKTTYKYDEPSLSPGGVRGNQTTVTVAGSQGGSSTTTKTYNTSGQVTASADGNSNSTGFSYGDTSAASPTTITHPATINGKHIEKYTWDDNSGQITSHTDENGIVTKYSYVDPFGRISLIDAAIGTDVESKTSYDYSTSNTIHVSHDKSSLGDGVLSTKTISDGLGRVVQTIDTAGYEVDTTYDPAGNVQSVSNPRDPSSSSSMDGLTTFAYDSLGRKTSQCNPDNGNNAANVPCSGKNSFRQWSYSGNVTSLTDEVSHVWKNTVDALGRLTNVLQPIGASTAYTYDALGNLLTVNQQGTSTETPRTRSFNYDSLSRLHCASNPENSQNPCPASATSTLPSGVTSYIYDANGNVTSKTDARGITTSYHYDGLNRLIQKNYSDGVTNTNLYGYDTSSVNFVPVPQNGRGNVQVSLANTIGRLTYASSTNSGTLEAFSYDSMGRVVNQWSTTPSYNNNNGPIAAISAGYDLAGNPTSLTYPDGRKVSQIINGAGRVSSVNYAAWNGTAHTSSYLSAVGGTNGYDAAGHLLGATLGNGVQVVSDYDNRERLFNLHYAGQANVTLWGRQYVWTPNSNLQSTTDWITKTQRVFTYDNLNRLTSAQDFLNTTIGDGTASAGPGAAECTSTSGGASSSGASPQWTDPDDSNVLISPGEPVNGAGWGFSQVSVQPNSLLAPDGSMTAHTVSATPKADSYIFDTASSETEFSGLPMTGSVWLKSLTGSNQNIGLSINANNAQGFQPVASKTVQLTTSWQQFQLSGMTPSTINSLNLVIGGGGSFTSGAVGLWQPRLENTGVANSTITNYQAYSQRFQQWTLVTGSNAPGSGVVDNAAVAPDGTQTAATVTPPTTCSGISSPCAPDFNMWLQVSNPAAFSNAAVTGSIWMRVASGTANVSLGLVETGSSSGPLVTHTFMLTTDWQRFQVSGITQQTLSFLELQIGGSDTLKSGQSIQVWGAQLELASVAGPYVPTGALPASAGTGITNILPYSQTFTNWAQHDASITGTVSAPDGSNTAAQVTAASTASAGEAAVDGYISEDVQNPTLYDAATITGSVFLRAPSGSGTIGVSFGTYTAASGFQYFMTQNFQLDTTWRRFTITGKVPNALQRLFLVVGGSGSFTNGQVVDIWGGQLELASTAGPYVATNGLPILAASEIMNILPSSQQISGPGWAAAAGSEFLNQAIAPDNTNTAAVFSAWTTSSDSAILDYVSNPSYYDGQTMTASVYLRVASGSQLLNLYLASVGDQTGLQIAGQQLVTLTSSWQRFEVTGTVPNGLSQLFFKIGGGGTLNNGESIQIWGAQMNPGSSAAPSQITSCTTPNPYSGGSGTLLPNGLNEAYSYDSFGNILQKGSFTASYTANNQLTNGLYDAAGNLLSNYLSPMTWDAENRLISVGGATYVYDANGNRVEKQGVGVTDTVYFGGRPVARLSSGQWTDLIYGPNGMLGEVAGTENADTSYRLLDNLGTEVGTVDGTGIMTNPLDYTPFGQVFSGSTNDPYLFTGKERDTESGLDYFGARYFGSSMGRFMSPDWSSVPDTVPYADFNDPQTLNLYAYAGNNPISYADADGHSYHICDAQGQNCSDVSDKDFDQIIKNARTAGEYWVNGNISLSDGTPGGSYKQTDVDLPGDPAATQAAANMIGNGGMGMVNMFMQNMAYSVVGGFIGQGIGLGIEALADGAGGAINTGTNAVYRSVNAAGEVQYVGITNSLATRAGQHAGRFAIEEIPGLSNLSRTDARAVEQVLIETHGLASNGGTLLNKINSIASTNPGYAQALQRGAQILEQVGYFK